MRKIFLVFLVSSCLNAQAAVNADLTGNMQLIGKPKSSQSFLDLIKCGLEQLPTNLLRQENIKANYTGAARVTVEQVVTDNTQEKLLLSFRVPSILRVANSPKKSKREAVKFGTVGVECTLPEDEVGNTGSANDNFSSSTSRVISKHHLRAKKTSRDKTGRRKNKAKNFLRNGSSGLTFSVKKLVAVRKGSKGKLKGSFIRKSDKAMGRFVVNFNYNE